MTDIAPPKLLPCPRCGASTFTRHEVKIHDEFHKKQDKRDERLEKVMDHLEQFLAAVEFEPDPDTGETQTFTGWMTDTDEILETLTNDVESLKNAAPVSATPFVLEVGEWPTDTDDTDDPEEPTSAPDEDAGFAAVDTADPTIAPDDDLEDPTSDDLDNRAAAALNAPITYGQTGVIA